MFVNASMAQNKTVKAQEARPPAAADQEQALRASHQQYLMQVGAAQDKDAFSALFEYYAPRIKSFLMKGGMSDAQADELAQDTMLAIWQKAGQYDARKAAPGTWIFTILRNKRIDALRKIKGYHYDIDDDFALADDADGPDALFAQAQREEMIADVMQRLNEEQRDLVYKSFFEGKTHAEIAAETDLPLGTVKSRIRLALKKLENMTVIKKLKDGMDRKE